MICPRCGSEMNHHAEKLVYPERAGDAGVDPTFGGIIEELHACPACGATVARRATSER